MKLVTPIILLLVAVALFFGYTGPAYRGTAEVRTEISSYDQALSQSRVLQERRDELLTAYNLFDAGNLERLKKLIPDNVDSVRLIMDIDAIASKYGMELREVAPSQVSLEQAGEQADSELGSMDLSFAVSTTYDNFKMFLEDLERSLRLIEVTNISFSSSSEDLYEYRVTIKTFWLR